jgi:hypothetical protein
MPAFEGEADMPRQSRNVAFSPKPDTKISMLFGEFFPPRWVGINVSVAAVYERSQPRQNVLNRVGDSSV